jgi:tetratricopeptide (TPR) repeat protein
MLLLVALAAAQNRGRSTIRIDVSYASGGHAGANLNVRLVQGINGMLVGVANTNSLGTVEFSDLLAGEYHVVVSGDGIETATSGSIEVNDWSVFQSQSVVVRPITQGGNSGAPTVGAADLTVPAKAVKEYNRGNEEMSRKQWEKAIDRFNKAIQIYPTFSAAYNNMAVCYGKLQQPDQQRKALEKIISLNERCVPALLNLSDIDMQEHKLAEAGALLEKALKVEPNDVEALSSLAKLDLEQGQYELAIAAVRKAHTLSHRDFAIVHFTSASAFEREGRITDAIAELQIFLQEAPQDRNAEAARKAIAGLQNRSQ